MSSDEYISRKVSFLMVELYLCTHQVTASIGLKLLFPVISYNVILQIRTGFSLSYQS